MSQKRVLAQKGVRVGEGSAMAQGLNGGPPPSDRSKAHTGGRQGHKKSEPQRSAEGGSRGALEGGQGLASGVPSTAGWLPAGSWTGHAPLPVRGMGALGSRKSPGGEPKPGLQLRRDEVRGEP